MNKNIFCKVKRLIFNDGSTLDDIEACLYGNFIIIAKDNGAPDFINVSCVAKLESVEEIKRGNPQRITLQPWEENRM